jgi:hypothetical protein
MVSAGAVAGEVGSWVGTTTVTVGLGGRAVGVGLAGTAVSVALGRAVATTTGPEVTVG